MKRSDDGLWRFACDNVYVICPFCLWNFVQYNQRKKCLNDAFILPIYCLIYVIWFKKEQHLYKKSLKKPRKNLVFSPNRRTPLPISWSQKIIFFLCLFCILDYSEHFNFSWKCTFLGGQKVGTGEPPPLAWKLSQLWPNFSRFPVWGAPRGVQ